MAQVKAKCTNCGTTLFVESMEEASICPQCGAAFIVKNAIDNFNYGSYGDNGQLQQNQQVIIPKKSISSAILKITISVVLVVALIVGGFFIYHNLVNNDNDDEHHYGEVDEKDAKGVLTGEYVSESGLYKIKFKKDFTCIWYQEVHGHQVYFDGTYELDEDGTYILNMDGETYSYNTQFEASLVEEGLIVTGGLVNGELFVKQ